MCDIQVCNGNVHIQVCNGNVRYTSMEMCDIQVCKCAIYKYVMECERYRKVQQRN